MKKQIEKFKNENIAINTETQQEYDELMELFDEYNIRWGTDKRATRSNFWGADTNETCINYEKDSNCIMYSPKDFYLKEGFNVIKYKDFIKDKPTKVNSKVNSKDLWEYIFNKVIDKKVKFKVYYDDCYVTEILWNEKKFEWETGTLTSEAFFNPLYDFEVIEEDKKIEKLVIKLVEEREHYDLKVKINELIDELNKLKGGSDAKR